MGGWWLRGLPHGNGPKPMILLPPVALATFAYHYGFVLLIQVENYVTNHALLGSGLWGVVRLLANMAFWQLEPLLFALGLGMLSVILGVHQNTYRASWKGKAFFGVMVGCNAWLVMDQIVFKVLADHAKLSMSDQGLADAAILSKVAGSALAEVDLVAVANFVLLVVASRWLYQVYFHSRVPFFLRAAGSSGGSGGSSSSSSSGSASARLHEVAAVRAVRVINRGLGALVLASLLACGVFGCMDDNSQVILERHAISAFLGDMLFVADRSDDAGWLATLFGGASAGRGRGGLRGVGGRRGTGGASPLSKNTAGANAVFRMRFGTAPGRPSTAFVDAAMERKEAAPASPGVDLEGLHLDPLDSATGNGAGGDKKPVADAVDAWVQSLIETRRRRRRSSSSSGSSSSSSSSSGGGGKNKSRLPNVVFFVLESVGSKQVLPGRGGVADPSVTPNVAALQNLPGSVTFRNVYNTFPSTTRTHLPAATGGITGTQGGIVAQLKNVYNGSTLVGRLRGLGYRTALFAASDLGFESLDTFLFNQGYDKFHHFGSASDAFKKDHYLNSWGGDDHSMVSEGLRWMGEQQQQQQQQQDNGDPGGGGGGGDNDADDDGNGDADRPWAMHFLSDATHHPYSVPQGYPKQFSGGDGRLDGYHNSMYYTDECVGKLIAGLKEAGVWEDTLFVLSGDHGEAFGAAGGDHARNYLHKNFLYEENVRTFLMLHDPNVRQGGGGDRPLVPLISERVASVGDIFPTIVAAATGSDASATHEPEDVLRRVLGSGSGGGGRRNRNQRPLDIPGRSLIASDWEARAVFFHKTSAPIQWGLRDGPFKFIANQVGSHAEIYDLRADPRERYNLVVTKARQDQTGGGGGGGGGDAAAAAAAASTVSSSGGYKPPADPWGELTAADGVEAMVEAYHGMAEDWFLDVHCRFMRQLNGYKHGGSCFEEEEEEEEDGGGGGGSDEKEHGDNSNNEKNKAADGKADAKNNKKKHHKKVTMRQAGPKKGAFGYKDGGGEFHELPWVPERASSVCFFTEWLPYDTSQRVLLDFAPVELHRGLQRANDPTPAVSQEMVVERRLSAEQRQVFEWTIEPAWHTTWWYFHMTAPLTAGKWEVIVWAGDDTTDGTRGSRLLVSQLLVKPSLPQPLPDGLSLFSVDEASGKPVSKRCRLTTRRVTPGFSAQNGTFYPATTFHPDQHWVSFEVKWQVCNSKRSITYRTADPSNEVYSFKQEVKGGWHTTWYHGAFNKPMKQSAWFITVWDDGSSRLVGSASFVVDAKAPILA